MLAPAVLEVPDNPEMSNVLQDCSTRSVADPIREL